MMMIWKPRRESDLSCRHFRFIDTANQVQIRCVAVYTELLLRHNFSDHILLLFMFMCEIIRWHTYNEKLIRTTQKCRCAQIFIDYSKISNTRKTFYFFSVHKFNVYFPLHTKLDKPIGSS